MDRPSRKTKTVNYCEAKDFEDDEDFAPPSKKTREGNKQEPKRPSSKSSSQESNPQSSQSQKSRKPLDEKLLERDLEAAITLSMLNKTDENMESSLTTADVTVHVPVDGNTLPSILNITNCSVDIEALGVDKITPERPTKDEDNDYQPKQTSDSESDEDFSEPDESEDEEFTVKVSKTMKKKNVTKSDKPKTTPAAKKEKPPPKPSKCKVSTAAVSTATRSPPPAKPAPRKSTSSSVIPTSRPLVSPSPAGGRIPKWNPPAQIGKSPTSSSSSSSSQHPAARSPGAGLRLGLSRLVRVKPLHPGVASH